MSCPVSDHKRARPAAFAAALLALSLDASTLVVSYGEFFRASDPLLVTDVARIAPAKVEGVKASGSHCSVCSGSSSTSSTLPGCQAETASHPSTWRRPLARRPPTPLTPQRLHWVSLSNQANPNVEF